jgi:hypothetical protein
MLETLKTRPTWLGLRPLLSRRIGKKGIEIATERKMRKYQARSAERGDKLIYPTGRPQTYIPEQSGFATAALHSICQKLKYAARRVGLGCASPAWLYMFS